MMTNLLNGAHVANKLFSTIARLRLLLVMFLTLTVSANVWADYTPGTGYTLVTDISSLSTNDKVILFCNQNGEGVSGYNGSKDATVSTTAADWIEYLVTKSTNSFTLKDGNKYIANPGGNEFKYGDSGGACTLDSDGLLICNSRNLMKNGSNYRFYATTQTYTNRFYVYKVAVSYAITAQSNNTTYGTVSLSGTIITASPKTGYRVSTSSPYSISPAGSAAVTQNGNTFAVTPTEDCTITINFEAIPKYTVTWNVNGEVYETTQVTEGSKPTFPATPSSCDATSTTFYGWATATWDGKIDDINGKTIYTSANEMPEVNGAVTYYAVFAKANISDGGGDYIRVTQNLADWSGDYLIAYSNTIFADGRIGGKEDGAIGYQNVMVDLSDKISLNTIPAADGDTYKVTLEAVTGGYVLKTQDGKYNYHTNNTGNDISASDKSTADKYPITVNFVSEEEINLCLGGNAIGSVFRYNVQGYFRFYKNGGQNPVYLYKKSAGTTTYSNYITTCSKQPSRYLTPKYRGGSDGT